MKVSLLLVFGIILLSGCVKKDSYHIDSEENYQLLAQRQLENHTITKETFLGLELLHEFNESELQNIESRRTDSISGGEVVSYKDNIFDVISLYITDFKVSKTFAYKKFANEENANHFMDLLIDKSRKTYPDNIFSYITAADGYRQLSFSCINSAEEWIYNFIANLKSRKKKLPLINEKAAFHPYINSYSVSKLNRNGEWVVSIDLTTALYNQHRETKSVLDGANINDI
ncbi:MAG: hypothetical protein OEY36_13430 [Gammaproteobacteria bacterium]|nr:hypothetical protein [Gammaproteobacteria bacterium]